ncbi:MAG: hypothetical protein HKN68_11170 [Saprospiraceae bacterium]|nr:hypothetical protein [Saprospiraceae bacterium]
MKRSRAIELLFFTLLLSLITSCYESVDGCLDPEATNYDVNADNDCDDCCILPSFNILMSYLVDGESYIDGNSFRVSQQGLMIEDFHFFISDISLIDPDGNEVDYEDEFLIYDQSQSGENITEDFKYFASNQFRGTLENIRYSGFINEIRFNIGLTERINSYDKDSLEVNTELSKAPDSVYVSIQEGYEFYSFQIRDTIENSIEIRETDAYPLPEINVILDDVEIRRGFNDELNLFIDFGLLFDGINLREMNESEVLMTIIDNFPGSFGKR